MRAHGFTLIELILVVVIIGILAGMVVIGVAGRVREAQIRRAQADIMSYCTAVDSYALDHDDAYPKTLQELVSGDRHYVRDLKKDPWRHDYLYKPGTDTKKADYQILSAGPDGQAGTEDDITRTTDPITQARNDAK